jgi:phosphatidylglycerol---prolipoprotein diacylglyceryl transferase
MLVHTVFDLIAAAASLALTVWVYRWRLAGKGPLAMESPGSGYAAALVIGAALGGYGLGTANLWLSGIDAIGRSILGALAGAILAIELFKRFRGIAGSTGLVFVAGFAVSVMIGRWGCFFSGLDDHTYGSPTSLPWGHDFGDGIARHPVQLYESASMAAFLVVALVLMARRQPFFMANGFYLMVAVYAGQRFVWEFLKPYGTVLGPFNIFHIVCAGLLIYAVAMIGGTWHERTAA